MIDTAATADILALYKKHGWTLRRVLLCAKTKVSLSPSTIELFESAEIHNSALDALWFSRRSKPESEAWELRRLGGSPFALVVVVEAGEAGGDLETILRSTEDRMLETPARETSH
jgi:hypothetical protein